MPAKHHWNFVLAGIGIIGTLVTVVTATDWRVRKYGPYLLAAFVAWGLASSIFYALRSKKPMTVLVAHTEDEVEAAWQLGDATYSKMKKHYPSETLVKSWWRRYPLGVWICRDEADEIWGYFSIWPIDQAVFHKLKDGTLLEDEITSEDVMSNTSGPHTYWYIADVCRTKKVANHAKEVTEYMVYSLVATAFRALIKRSQISRSAEILAFAESRPGTIWLKEFEFTLINKKKKIWFKAVTRKHVSNRIKHCCSHLLTGEAKAHAAIYGE